MSTPTDVLPGAGWYRDPSNPATARWWDGSGWTTQTQELPPAPAAVAPPAPALPPAPGAGQPTSLIGIAEPVQADPDLQDAEPVLPAKPSFLSRLTPKPKAKPAAGAGSKAVKRPSFRVSTPRISLPGNPLVAVLLALLLAAGGWYAWTSLHGSSASPVVAPHVHTTPVKPTPAKPTVQVRLPKTALSDLATVPWDAHTQSRSRAAHIAAEQRSGGHRTIASFYGDSGADRFFFLGSNVLAADRKPVSAAVQRTRLVHLLDSAMAAKASGISVTRLAVKGVVASPLTCVSGHTHGGTVSLCSWQNSSTRVVVAQTNSVAAVQRTMSKVLADLSH